jgi:peptidoglycan hydrolase CwlO-like protein
LNKRSILTISFAATLALGSFSTIGQVTKAESMDSLKSKQQHVQEKKGEVNQNIQSKDQHITDVINKQKELEKQIMTLDAKINSTNDRIAEKEKKINDTTKDIEQLKAEIEVLKKKIAERNQLLKDRARAMQQQGGSANYLDVMLGAESFGDFLDRASAVNTLVNADREIMEEQKRDQDSLEKKQKQVEDKLEELRASKMKLLSLKSDLSTQKGNKDSLITQLAAQENELKKQKINLQVEEEDLTKMDASISNQIVAEQSRLAELARQKELEHQRQLTAQRKAEADRVAAEQAREAAAQGSTPATSAPAVSAPSAAAPESYGTWTRPAPGYISTEFGYDVVEGQPRFHYGLDIAAKGYVPIVAAANGYVFATKTESQSGGYGNEVMITHSIDGRTMTTVYGHLTSYSVSPGQYVQKGQFIGVMGSTGHSTGQHLHFEIHEGSWNAAKSNAVNPRKYMNF